MLKARALQFRQQPSSTQAPDEEGRVAFLSPPSESGVCVGVCVGGGVYGRHTH